MANYFFHYLYFNKTKKLREIFLKNLTIINKLFTNTAATIHSINR